MAELKNLVQCPNCSGLSHVTGALEVYCPNCEKWFRTDNHILKERHPLE